jgi:hypothetical protein
MKQTIKTVLGGIGMPIIIMVGFVYLLWETNGKPKTKTKRR